MSSMHLWEEQRKNRGRIEEEGGRRRKRVGEMRKRMEECGRREDEERMKRG